MTEDKLSQQKLESYLWGCAEYLRNKIDAGDYKVFGHVARDQNLVPQDWQGGKPEIREELRSRLNGEEQWQRLQGQVYGKYMHRAELFPEVANFLLRLKRRKDEVFIVAYSGSPLAAIEQWFAAEASMPGNPVDTLQ